MENKICVLMLTETKEEELLLKEFVQTEEKKTVPKQNFYPMYALAQYLRVSKIIGKSHSTTENERIYQFAFARKENSINGFKKYSQLAVIIPKTIEKKYTDDSKFIAFQKMLNVVSGKTKTSPIKPKKGKKFSLQKNKKHIGNIAVALTVAATVSLSVVTYQKVSDYKAEQEKQRRWQAFEQLLHPNEEPTIEQLQEEYHKSQLDEWDLRLQQEREEEGKTRGMN